MSLKRRMPTEDQWVWIVVFSAPLIFSGWAETLFAFLFWTFLAVAVNGGD